MSLFQDHDSGEAKDPMNKRAQSSDLVIGMADLLGIDLAARLARRPELEAIRLHAAIERCSHCTQQEDCVMLQDCSQALDQTPEYCRNRQVFGAAHRF